MSVPPFFPLIRPGCEDIAAKYFQCVQDTLKDKGDLVQCDKQPYVQCTNKALNGVKTAVLTEYQK
jgi:hypothetical protein